MRSKACACSQYPDRTEFPQDQIPRGGTMLGTMTEYKIYPAIGVARVGNAPEKFYIGPETYRGLPINPGGGPFNEADFRDRAGRLCRQAARFRIYRTENAGV